MTEQEKTALLVQHAFVLRALARAINRMERSSGPGLYHDAQQLRAELATMGIELILPADDESKDDGPMESPLQPGEGD